MSLASFEDAREWLDKYKITFETADDAVAESAHADAIVRAYLAGTFPDHVGLWDKEPTGNQEATPEIIVQIAAMLMASYRYAKVYSEESLSHNSYAFQLEQRAMKLLSDVSNGLIDLADENYASSAAFAESDFWPNDKTVKEGTNEPLRAFNMEQTF